MYQKVPNAILIQCLLLASIALFCPVLFAQEPQPEKTDKTELSDWEETLIKDNITLSRMFDGLADGIDSFLVDSVSDVKPNESSVKIENSTSIVERKKIANVTDLNVNLRLPKVEEYWQLKFTTYDEQKSSRGVRNSYLKQTPRDRTPGAQLGIFREFKKIRVSFKPRLQLTDPLKVAHSLSFETSLDREKLDFNPKIEFFADPSKGTGIFEALNFNFVLTKVYSLTLINEGEYQEQENKYSATNGFAIGQILTEKSSLSYNLFFSSDNRPVYRLVSYNASISYNKLVYKKILDYQIVPNLDFAKANKFRPVPGIAFNFSINF